MGAIVEHEFGIARQRVRRGVEERIGKLSD